MDVKYIQDYPWETFCNLYCRTVDMDLPTYVIMDNFCHAEITGIAYSIVYRTDDYFTTKNLAAYQLLKVISSQIELPSELFDWQLMVKDYCLNKYNTEPIYEIFYDSCTLIIPGIHEVSDIPTIHTTKLIDIISYKYYCKFIAREVAT